VLRAATDKEILTTKEQEERTKFMIKISEPFVAFVRLRGEKASLHSVARVTIQKILGDLWQ
jgi:hypothetical protein